MQTIYALVLIGSVAAKGPTWDLFEETYGKKQIDVRNPITDSFRFASSQGDGMVLQMAPAQATVWGFAPAGQAVTVTFRGQKIAAATSKWLAQDTWIAKLPATSGGLTPFNITAESNGKTITLANVVFGDVWVCSGQSNMAYPLGSSTCWDPSNIDCHIRPQTAQCSYGCVENAGAEIAAMADYPNLRLYQNAGGSSDKPVAESGNSGWKLPKDMGGRFSAMCWFFGRDLYTSLASAGKSRPIGLIETNVGGTPDEHWSSPDALSKCKHLNKPWEWPANFTDSVLWNGKVVPLLRNTIKGAIWMQGEANAHKDGRQYKCSFPAMIEDWRAKWAQGTGGTTDPHFPFGWAQLNSDGGAKKWTPNATVKLDTSDDSDPLGEWHSGGFPGIRLAEENTRSVRNTFQAVILDTPVTSGSVHSPYKQAPGSRLARGALATAYEMPQTYPVFSSATQSGDTVTIKLDGFAAGNPNTLELRNSFGFEVLGSDKLWRSIPIAAVAGNSIIVGSSGLPAKGIAIRYLWDASPCTKDPYKCPVYVTVKKLGTLSGEFDSLPLGPFIKELSQDVLIV